MGLVDAFHGNGFRLCAGAVALLLLQSFPRAQTEGAPESGTLAFEVASIRPDLGGDTPIPIPARIGARSGGRFEAVASLRDLIRHAFDLQPFQRVIGTQDVLDERFVIHARVPDHVVLAREAVPPLVQRLLADRFRLRVRFDEDTQTVLVLRRVSPDRLGPRIRPATLECPEAAVEQQGVAQEERWIGERVCRRIIVTNGELRALVGRMSDYTRVLSISCATQGVIDESGLEGPYAFEMTYDTGSCPGGMANLMRVPQQDALPTIFDALRRDLGLRLDSERRTVPVLVVEHVEEPTPN